jgi:hypothetical protein
VNWLADATKCAIRLKNESGCTILAGRSEVTGRITKLHRSEEGGRTFWSWGHVYAVEDKGTGGQRVIRAGISGETKATETPSMLPEAANALADALRAAYVQAGSSDCGGDTIMDLIWREMMVVTDRLIGISEAGEEPDPDDVGAARSLAWVLAVMQNPYLPNVDSVREQVMERWENENANGKPTNVEDVGNNDRLARRRAARRARRG